MTTDRRDLSKLASQLHSEHDRQHYAKVIHMAENLQARIQELQKLKGSCSSNNSKSFFFDKHLFSLFIVLASTTNRSI